MLTTPHMTGDDVAYAQRVLKNHGGYYQGDIDGEFGPLSAQASYRAQYWLGYANPSQTFGTTLEKLLLGRTQPTPDAQKRIAERKKKGKAKPLREKALTQMKKLVGVTERPPESNHVPEVTFWWGADSPSNAGTGPAWCAMTVSKAYILAGSKAFTRGGFCAYVPTIVGTALAARNGLTVTLDPQPGDLVCFDWDGRNFSTGNNHIGMFVSGTKSSFKTIEGNVDSRCDYHDRTSSSAPHVVFVHVSK